MVDDNDVKRYLLKNKVLTKANMRTYKISRHTSVDIICAFFGLQQYDSTKHVLCLSSGRDA